MAILMKLSNVIINKGKFVYRVCGQRLWVQIALFDKRELLAHRNH